MRLVSLLPAGTDIVCLLGLADQLVDAGGADLAALAPDVVITGPDAPGVPAGVRLVELAPLVLADVWRDMRAVAAACGVDPDPPVRALRKRLLSLQIRTAAVERQNVVLLSSSDPLAGAGLWLPELVELTGGDLLLAAKGEPAGPITPEALLATDPDVLIVAGCGLSLDANRAAWRQLEKSAWVRRLAAVRRGRVFAADGTACFWQPGPQLVRSAEVLSELLHRDPRLAFGHENSLWARVA